MPIFISIRREEQLEALEFALMQLMLLRNVLAVARIGNMKKCLQILDHNMERLIGIESNVASRNVGDKMAQRLRDLHSSRIAYEQLWLIMARLHQYRDDEKYVYHRSIAYGLP